MTTLPAHVSSWLEDPDGGGCFTGQAGPIRAHSPTCTSLTFAWLPYRGGRTALGDIFDCHGCEITFFWEGLRTSFDDCPHSDHWYCQCCRTVLTTCGCGVWA